MQARDVQTKELMQDAVTKRRGGSWGTRLEALALPIAGLIVIAVFGVLRPTTFLTVSNLASILSSQAVLVVVTLGLMIVLIAGDFDLSVASVIGLSGMTVAILSVQHGVPLALSMALSLLLSVLIGFINGFFTVVVGINSLIVTLGMGSVVGGVVLWMSNANIVSGISSALVNPVIVWRFLGIPLSFYYAILIAGVTWYILRFTPVGRRLTFVGRSQDVSYLSGINVRKVRWGSLIVSSLFAGIAGWLYIGTTGAAGPMSGQELLLPAFAAAFLGTTAIAPGRFNVWGTVIAVYFLVTGITGFQLMGAQSYVQDLFYGVSLILAVALSHYVKRRRERRRLPA